MRGTILMLLLLATSSSAVADWALIDGDEKQQAYADYSRIQKIGDRVKIWSMIDLKEAGKLSDGKFFLSWATQYEFDCKEHQSRIYAATMYSENMGEGEVTNKLDYESPGWESVPPSSKGDVLFQFACITRLQTFAETSGVPALVSPPWTSGMPNPTLTPGAIISGITQENIQSTVCVRGYNKTVRPPASYTDKLMKRQIREYKYTDRNPRHYEEDHLIPLSIGGSPRDSANLWPEPRGGEWNVTKKDKLEIVIYKMVCANEISLKEAQDEIASSWIEAYKKYVHEKR